METESTVVPQYLCFELWSDATHHGGVRLRWGGEASELQWRPAFFGGARMITGFVCPHRLWSTGRLSGCFWIRLMFGIGNPSIVQRPQLMLVGLSRSLSTAETLSQAVVAWLIRRTVTSPVRRLVSY